jgi:hypothetical protein
MSHQGAPFDSNEKRPKSAPLQKRGRHLSVFFWSAAHPNSADSVPGPARKMTSCVTWATNLVSENGNVTKIA